MQEDQKAKGIMILIEFKDTVGLQNFTNEMEKRNISMTKNIEACTGIPVRIISSRYMASDMTTLRVAEELGIPYITSRGTTDTKATVYQPEGYNTKILSISNIPIATFKYGSLCDYWFLMKMKKKYRIHL